MQRLAPFLLAGVVLSGCWHGMQPGARTAVAREPPALARPAPSYRHVTLAIDAVGVGLLAASTLAYSLRGGNDVLATGLAFGGGLTAAFGAPVVHGIEGHRRRAGASYLARSMFVSVGMLIAMQVDCSRDPDALCGLGPALGWGAVGGFALASTIDAFFLHGTSSTWAPTLTPSEDGVRVGVTKLF